jgi:hypothetical protein
MESLKITEELTPKQSIKIKDVIKDHMEGKIVDLAVAMKNSSLNGTSFSRSTGSYHSRSGHDFSRGKITPEQIIPNYLKDDKEISEVVNSYIESLKAL